ncbi:MAG: GAF domain-containing protein [Patescibacteria group bacterium]|nr:GAF domain-containing protein [Patescibacteria group bacterium]
MTPSPIPENEEQRLNTLEQLKLLSPLHEDRFDRITRIASAVLGMPVAMINLITAREDINKSCYGMAKGAKNDRRVSFCSYTILSDEPMVIENTLEHEQFKDHPQVAGGMNIRSYAGMPIRAADGTRPGALCLVDTKPHKFSEKELQILKDLSHWAELEINAAAHLQTIAVTN